MTLAIASGRGLVGTLLLMSARWISLDRESAISRTAARGPPSDGHQAAQLWRGSKTTPVAARWPRRDHGHELASRLPNARRRQRRARTAPRTRARTDPRFKKH